MPPNGPAQRSPGSPAFAAPWFTLPLLAFFGLHLRPTTAQAENVCVTHDQPNTLFQDYPNNATGVLNVTLAIIPIPLATAQEIIPSEYAILESAYRSLLPDFPADMYPVLLQAGHDHDIRYLELSIPDFSVSSMCCV
ncbi:hypothetical protein FALCPG4_015103 [Fusarium falciforme]